MAIDTGIWYHSDWRNEYFTDLGNGVRIVGDAWSQQQVPTWDLDILFPGGSTSPRFLSLLNSLEEDLARLAEGVIQLPNAYSDAWLGVVELAQDIIAKMREAGSFVGCLTAQNVKDEQAKLLSHRVTGLRARLSVNMTNFDAKISQLNETDWRELVTQEDLAPLAFFLHEHKERAKEKLDPARETVISNLMVDGYHAWGDLYDTVVGRIEIAIEENGTTSPLSVGQTSNKLAAPEKQVRDQVFEKWEDAWAKDAELCASALNHLAGFRLSVYEQRDWKSVLQEPLEMNRMSAQTLNVMWDVIDQNKSLLLEYLARKAQLLGLKELNWTDVSAPLSQNSRTFTYQEAQTFVVDHFSKFSSQMAEFAQKCFRDRWIEVEDRPGKMPGGFCTSFPVSEATRIFMTFSGTTSNVFTLAHELGHAYHQHVMRGVPVLLQSYAMNVAETASTFAEMIVGDAAVQIADSKEERIALLEDKIQNSIAMYMNIHARFLFETRFYEQRKHGTVSVEELNRLMETAQRDAFKNALSGYHPYFWAAKLHFYITDVPFYNFPYTFGYLFSAGIYARAKTEGAGFAEKYVDLLRDTGRMRVEDLAAKHLGVDLTKPEFWQSAVDLTLSDVREFLSLTE